MTQPTTIIAAPGLPFLEIAREFDAPVAAVFRAHIDPHLFTQWTGPRAIKLHDVELNPTTGGLWRYSVQADGHPAFGFSGVFHTVEPNALIIQTFEFSLAPAQVGISTLRFDEVDGRTRLSVHEVYSSIEARDAAVASGMESGILESYERLDELLAPAGAPV